MTNIITGTPQFISGLKLAKAFFEQAVQPIISQEYPRLRYGASLLGPGSEVLGFDDVVSTDHHWGPRVQLFLSEKDLLQYREPLKNIFNQQLPLFFRGYSTNWTTPDPANSNNQFLVVGSPGHVNHRVEITSVQEYLVTHLGITQPPLMDSGWIFLPEQKLLEFTAGVVFYDSLGELTATRAKLCYYPDSMRALKLHALWTMITEELAFVGRAGEVEDDVGSRLEAARLARWLVQVAFALERRYAPYPKWFGKAFAHLRTYTLLIPILKRILQSDTWQDREAALCEIIGVLLKEHILQGLIPPQTISAVPYFTRAQHVINLGPVLKALRDLISPTFQGYRQILCESGTVNEFLVHPKLLADISALHDLRRAFSIAEDPETKQ